jgi:hypothetical protein
VAEGSPWRECARRLRVLVLVLVLALMLALMLALAHTRATDWLSACLALASPRRARLASHSHRFGARRLALCPAGRLRPGDVVAGAAIEPAVLHGTGQGVTVRVAGAGHACAAGAHGGIGAQVQAEHLAVEGVWQRGRECVRGLDAGVGLPLDAVQRVAAGDPRRLAVVVLDGDVVAGDVQRAVQEVSAGAERDGATRGRQLAHRGRDHLQRLGHGAGVRVGPLLVVDEEGVGRRVEYWRGDRFGLRRGHLALALQLQRVEDVAERCQLRLEVQREVVGKLLHLAVGLRGDVDVRRASRDLDVAVLVGQRVHIRRIRSGEQGDGGSCSLSTKGKSVSGEVGETPAPWRGALPARRLGGALT